jgi:uncharacterized protein YeaO (DUF488 family)
MEGVGEDMPNKPSLLNIYTSYFAVARNIPISIAQVSIAAKAPDGFAGIQYKKLAPSWSIYKEYKESGDTTRYTKRYTEEILGNLKQDDVIEDLSKFTSTYNVVLLCYEKTGSFCHRHIVSEWLEVDGANVLGELMGLW